MGQHSVAQAKNQLPSLIDRALAGETVVITRHGRPVAELRAVAPPARPITPAALAWLAKRRDRLATKNVVKARRPNAKELVSRMRDEDWR